MKTTDELLKEQFKEAKNELSRLIKDIDQTLFCIEKNPYADTSFLSNSTRGVRLLQDAVSD